MIQAEHPGYASLKRSFFFAPAQSTKFCLLDIGDQEQDPVALGVEKNIPRFPVKRQ
jgi:hypothetical protein